MRQIFESFATAEREAFGILCNATGAVDGRDAFLLDMPIYKNAWAFTFTGSAPSEPAFWAAHSIPAIPMTARARGVYSRREDLWRFVGLVVNALPVERRDHAVMSPLELFRLNGIGGINEQVVAFPNEDKASRVYVVELTFQAVVRTGGREEDDF